MKFSFQINNLCEIENVTYDTMGLTETVNEWRYIERAKQALSQAAVA